MDNYIKTALRATGEAWTVFKTSASTGQNPKLAFQQLREKYKGTDVEGCVTDYTKICEEELPNIKNAETYLDYGWPVIKATDYMAYKLTGNRRPNETTLFARRTALAALVLGEVTEYQGRFLPDIVNGLLAVCEETYWGYIAELPALRSFAPAAHPQKLFCQKTFSIRKYKEFFLWLI